MTANIRRGNAARKNRRTAAAVILFWIGWVGLDAARAAETIRVALFLDLPAVTVSGNSGVSLSSAEGRPIAKKSVAPVEIVSGPGGLVINGKKTDLRRLIVSSADGTIRVNDLAVGGILQIRLQRDGLRVVNELDLEEYLKGVVPVEISPDWNPEALKVQAIIARTYALHQKRANPGKEYDLLATTDDQLYAGRAKERPAANQAVAATRGWILTYDGEPILAAYHSTSAGPTEDAAEVWGMDLPYLKGVSCPFDLNSPYYRWTRAIPMDRVQEDFLKAGYSVGTIASVTPFHWTRAGRIDQLRILHSNGDLILKAGEFRRILGYSELRSARFVIEKIGREIRIQGMGSGHAVGLCQWGAKEMAEMGYDYEKILKYYYPGVGLQPYSELTMGNSTP